MKAINLFKKKRKHTAWWITNGPFKKKKKPWRWTAWWATAKERYEKDTSAKVKDDEPEFDAQKIYQHWLNLFK